MSPPSLDVAREILTSELARMRSMAGFNSSRSVEIAAAIGVVLARLALDGAEIAACSAAAGGDRGSDERLSEYIARLRVALGLAVDEANRCRTAALIPVYGPGGGRIGEGRADGATFIARITDEQAAAMLRASTGPRGVSVGYRVKVEPEPAVPVARAMPVSGCGASGAYVEYQFGIERDPVDPTRLHVTGPDPRPSPSELGEMRAAVRALIAQGPEPGESVAQFRDRVKRSLEAPP